MPRVARVRLNGQTQLMLETSSGWVRPADINPELATWGALVSAGLSEVAQQLEAYVSGAVPTFSWEELRRHGVLPPVPHPGKVVGVGLNYREHAEADFGGEVPEAPLLFAKWPSSLTGAYDPVTLPLFDAREIDYEVELAVVIGRSARDVKAAETESIIAGYSVGNDLTARDVQRRESQWTRAKSFDGFCPLGPWLTAMPLEDVTDLSLRSYVNGECRQDGRVSQMVFSVGDIVQHLSRSTTLDPGDIILTGTPVGVGMGQGDGKWLQEGDVVACEIEGLGKLENRMAAPTD